MRRLVLACLALLAPLTTLPAAELWTEDFAAAKAQAKTENKDLLLDFTGSDWCGWCVRLKDEVFSTPEFQAAAPKRFVLVELDYPQNKPQSDAIKLQNAKLKSGFSIKGYPSIYLTDAEGRPYAKTGYQEGGPEAYVKMLESLAELKVKRDAALAQANQAKGLARAKALDAVLDSLGDAFAPGAYATEIAAIIADGDDALKSKYVVSQAKATAEDLLGAGDIDGAKKTVDGALAIPGIPPASAQDLHFFRAALDMESGDPKAALARLQQALAVAPESDLAQRLKSIIEQLKGQIGK
ncbi:hypothetical protein LBMAG53_08120 [Planctomycetota bacterium]|nr:hypothetical protein LBMAG53_08120 [Planctomycetota bacterium]